jgi:Recombination endonuclease VII
MPYRDLADLKAFRKRNYERLKRETKPPRTEPKTCGGCGETKPPEQFYKRTVSWEGLTARCKTCWDAQKKAYKERDLQAHRRKHRLYAMKSRNGLTSEEYDALLAVQGGVCAICGSSGTEERRLCIDHDHTSGKVRSLLCDECNIGLGKFMDDPDLLQAAINYLASH